MSLSTDDVRWVAQLSRLELADSDLPDMTRQLNAILDYVDQLQKVNTDGIEPLDHPLQLQNVLRDDELAESLPVDDVLGNAPQRQDDFFAVPPVFD